MLTMKMRKIVYTGVLSLTLVMSQAQTLNEAISKTENERFEAAAADFRSLISKDPAKGDNYFYFGENYFKHSDLDSAMLMYKKGAEVQATNPLNYVGIGKVLLYEGKETDANTNLYKAKALAPKNGIVLMKIAEAFTNAPQYKNLPKAVELLNEAIKYESKNPEAYILLGDALLEQSPTDGGPAIKQYEKAADLDKKSVKAILRIGKLYQRGRSYDLAMDYYKKAEAIDATFAPAYREKAELWHRAGKDDKAIENYKKYLELNNSLAARDRYASFLFLNKQYKEAVSEIETIQQKDQSSPYLYRILGYAYCELGDKTDKDAYAKGLAAINLFFTKTDGKNFKYIADDYKYKGLLMARGGNDSLGVLEIEKAISMDPVANCELSGEIGKIYVKAKKYEKSIPYFEKKGLCPKGLNGQDYFDYGRAYYYLGAAKQKESADTKEVPVKQKKEIEAKELFVKADTCFSKLCQSSPAFATAYFWRAKANLQLDLKNELWLAKPHYEKALSLVKPEERGNGSNKTNVIDACEYLSYCYLQQKDKVKAKEYVDVLTLVDPANKKLKGFNELLK